MGGDRRPNRAGLRGKGHIGSGWLGFGLYGRMSGGGTGLVDGDTDGSAAG